MTTSLLAKQFQQLLSKRYAQQICGMLIISFGLYNVPWHVFADILKG